MYIYIYIFMYVCIYILLRCLDSLSKTCEHSAMTNIYLSPTYTYLQHTSIYISLYVYISICISRYVYLDTYIVHPYIYI